MSDTISSPSPSRLIVDVVTATLAENAPRWPGMNLAAEYVSEALCAMEKPRTNRAG
jgi:hypothetical protein